MNLDVEVLQEKAQLQRNLGLSTEQIDDLIIEQINLDELLAAVQTIDRCSRGGKLSLSMNYLDLNNAIVAIRRVGLKVVASSSADLSRFVSNVEMRQPS